MFWFVLTLLLICKSVAAFINNESMCSMRRLTMSPCFHSELETKRILLDIFKEKQQKTAEAGTIPSFYKKVSHFILIR